MNPYLQSLPQLQLFPHPQLDMIGIEGEKSHEWMEKKKGKLIGSWYGFSMKVRDSNL